MSIPLRLYVTPFANRGVLEPAQWDCDTAKKALDVVNTIWSKAKIAFVISDCILDKPLDMAPSRRSSDEVLLGVLASRHDADNAVHIFLVNSIASLNAGGGSYPNGSPEPASFVQWYGNDHANGRAWAHELGHLMELDHVEIDYSNEKQAAQRVKNLMVKGLSAGSDLTSQQISTAKGSKLVKRFGG
ncbi:hypothetical protein [Bradyrhizobium sp. USDA 329]|jgi:hypothetical protein|uniref:hypothetical protein n=1 Tax=unclassified Bradyrhizobium TaxID=2631580 RepID=UPI003519B4A5